jgi:hypothetical protein
LSRRQRWPNDFAPDHRPGSRRRLARADRHHPFVNRDPSADRLAKNQTLYSWVAPTIAIADIAPGATVPQPADRTLGNKSISITNFKAAPFYFTGEEEKQLNATGSYGGVVADTVEQAIRTIVNQVESDLALAMQVGASRAYGTVATTPFATNLAESAQIRKILDDNGAPRGPAPWSSIPRPERRSAPCKISPG